MSQAVWTVQSEGHQHSCHNYTRMTNEASRTSERVVEMNTNPSKSVDTPGSSQISVMKKQKECGGEGGGHLGTSDYPG